jgi:hypothetical protein
MRNWWLFDTDMLLHSLSLDVAVRGAVENTRAESAPIAVSAFSQVELKGNYIQDLLLLRRKINDSDSLPNCVARIIATGGRRLARMFAQLTHLMSEADLAPGNWSALKYKLVPILDGQVPIVWDSVATSLGEIVDDFECDRAAEPPQVVGQDWTAIIPECAVDNTTCSIVAFFDMHAKTLEKLDEALESLGAAKTAELERIHSVIKSTRLGGRYPWEGRTCRRIADLLIGLQSKAGKGLISSNRAEHTALSEGAGYEFREFPIAKIRTT